MSDFEGTPLEQVLSRNPQPASQPEAQPDTGAKAEAEAPEVEVKQEAEPVKEDVKPEAKKEADSSPESEPSMLPASVMHGERERRQAAERELKELRAKFAELEKKEPEKRPSVFEDEEGAFQAYQQTITSTVTNELLNAGEQEAISQHGQEAVDAAVEWLQQTVASSPSLEASVRSVPAMFLHRKAVELHKAELARAELADPDKLREKIRAEEREKLLKEQEKLEAAKKAKRDSIPTSLVGEDSKGGLKGTEWSGPTPLSAILPR